MLAYSFVTVIYITKKSLSTFWETYALVIFNRNKVKDSEKLSAPVSETVLEYEKSFQVERQRKFIAVIFVSPLISMLIKVLSLTFICLLYLRMLISKTQQNSPYSALTAREQQKVWSNGASFVILRFRVILSRCCAELQHGTSLGTLLLTLRPLFG